MSVKETPSVKQTLIPQDSSTKSQERRLFSQLLQVPASTFYFRTELDIAHPAARVLSLRKQGLNIETVWCDELSLAGTVHRIAKYILLPSEDQDE